MAQRNVVLLCLSGTQGKCFSYSTKKANKTKLKVRQKYFMLTLHMPKGLIEERIGNKGLSFGFLFYSPGSIYFTIGRFLENHAGALSQVGVGGRPERKFQETKWQGFSLTLLILPPQHDTP